MNGPSNGGLSGAILWIAGALFGLVQLLVGVVLRQHQKVADERQKGIEKELDLLRQRSHEQGNRISELLTRRRWQDEDREKRGD